MWGSITLMRGNRSCRGNAGWVVSVDEAAWEIGTVQPDTRGPQDGRRDGKPVGLENLSRCWHLPTIRQRDGIRGSGKLNAGAVLAPRRAALAPLRSIAFSGGHLRPNPGS